MIGLALAFQIALAPAGQWIVAADREEVGGCIAASLKGKRLGANVIRLNPRLLRSSTIDLIVVGPTIQLVVEETDNGAVVTLFGDVFVEDVSRFIESCVVPISPDA